ncbi:growth arrest and DNA damage-inducible proteins-interacting protein 1-like [Haliotis rubra]|uniref:growth arrest and DNA damage-inducible proteins-interacting protein 1-like n=1 Tax=Haliotis rubra TaxID=36100 RepID=UPI001EE50363|nr:growth arrest and DNA damage-inducible proteins-interacting protein 1-like [Haliotis rubra]
MATSMCKLCSSKLSTLQIFLRRHVRLNASVSNALFSSGPSPDDEEVLLKPKRPVIEDEDIIEKLRDVSLLRGNLYKRQHNLQLEIRSAYQRELRYRRRNYAKFGDESGFDPRKCWPTRRELRDEIKLEKEWEPTLDSMMKNIQRRKQADEAKMAKRVEMITKNMEKMDGWIKEYHQREEKRTEEVKQRELKKKKLLDDAMAFFGYKVDPRDEKFKEMLEAKAKEEKRLAKQKKKETQTAKLMARIQAEAQKKDS